MTRCPHCSTTFRVTEEQLALANGSVRCGSCLQVFDATVHFVTALSLDPDKAKLASMIHDGDDEPAFDNYYAVAATSEPTEQEDYDESWAEQLLKELEEEEDTLDVAVEVSKNEPVKTEPTTENQNPLDSADRYLNDVDLFEPDTASSKPPKEFEQSKEPEDSNSSSTDDEFDMSFFEQELASLKSGSEPNQSDLSSLTGTTDTNTDSLAIETNDNTLDASSLEVALDVSDSKDSYANRQEPSLESDHINTTHDLADDLNQIAEEQVPSSDIELNIETLSTNDILENDNEPPTTTLSDIDQDLEAVKQNIIPIANEPIENENDDEAWARAMLAEIESEDQESLNNTQDNQQQNTHHYDTTELNQTQQSNPSTETAEQLNFEPMSSSDNTLTKKKVQEKQQLLENDTSTIDEISATEPDHSTENIELISQSDTTDAILHPAKPSNPDEILQSLDNEFDLEEEDSPRTRQRLFWAAACIVPVLGLLSQYIYFNFEQLATTTEYRQELEMLCSYTGCELPDLVAIEQIISKDLRVREHPDIEKALIIDVIMYNSADFAQPLPNMAIHFSDLNEKPIAYRSFKPSEYLGILDQKLDKIPAKTPIHISLEIVDPGDKALSYRLEYELPPPSSSFSHDLESLVTPKNLILISNNY